MTTKTEQEAISSAFQDVRQAMVRIEEVSNRKPSLKRDADFGDVAANTVMAYWTLLGLYEKSNYTVAVQIAMNDLFYLNSLKSMGLWPDESLLKAARMGTKSLTEVEV